MRAKARARERGAGGGSGVATAATGGSGSHDARWRAAGVPADGCTASRGWGLHLALAIAAARCGVWGRFNGLRESESSKDLGLTGLRGSDPPPAPNAHGGFVAHSYSRRRPAGLPEARSFRGLARYEQEGGCGCADALGRGGGRGGRGARVLGIVVAVVLGRRGDGSGNMVAVAAAVAAAVAVAMLELVLLLVLTVIVMVWPVVRGCPRRRFALTGSICVMMLA
eukprot:2846357-Pleurochrysis_carterae.AAC.1